MLQVAIRTFCESLKITQVTPEQVPPGYVLEAAAYFCTGEYANAFNLLVELESTFGHAADFLSLFAATPVGGLGEPNKAEELFKRALEISPDSPEVRNNYANLLIDLNRYDEASKY